MESQIVTQKFSIKSFLISIAVLIALGYFFEWFQNWKLMLTLCGISLFLSHAMATDSSNETKEAPVSKAFGCAAGVLALTLILSPEAFGKRNTSSPAKIENNSEINDLAWIEITKDAIKARLKDSNSAKFRGEKLYRGSGTPVVCGQVNSKNSMGGFTGFQRYVASGDQLIFLEEEVQDFPTAWKKLCIN